MPLMVVSNSFADFSEDWMLQNRQQGCFLYKSSVHLHFIYSQTLANISFIDFNWTENVVACEGHNLVLSLLGCLLYLHPWLPLPGSSQTQL